MRCLQFIFFLLLPAAFSAHQALAENPVVIDPAIPATPITAAALSLDGTMVVLGSQNGLEIRNWPQLEPIAAIETDLEHIHDLSFSPDGNTLLIAGGSPAEEGAVQVVRWSDRTTLRRVSGHNDVVSRVVWTPDGQAWITSGMDHLCHVFSAESGALLLTFDGHSRPVMALCCLDSADSVASAGIDQTIRVWNRHNGKLLRTLDNHLAAINGIAECSRRAAGSPGVVATISDDRTVRFWQPEIGRMMRFAKLPSIPRALAWSVSGDHLYAGCDDGKIRVVGFDTSDVVTTLEGIDGRIYELIMDRDGARLLVVGEGLPKMIRLPE